MKYNFDIRCSFLYFNLKKRKSDRERQGERKSERKE